MRSETRHLRVFKQTLRLNHGDRFGKLYVIDHDQIIPEDGEAPVINGTADGYPTGWWNFRSPTINMTYPSSARTKAYSDPYSVFEGLRIALNAFFSGNITGPIGGPEPLSKFSDQVNVSSNNMFAFNQSTDISPTVQNAATAMTNYLRSLSNEMVSGQAGGQPSVRSYRMGVNHTARRTYLRRHCLAYRDHA